MDKMNDGFKIGGTFFVECYGPDGKLKWTDTAKNIVVNVGLDHILDVVLDSTTTKIGTWYVGLKNAGSPVAGDTLASHGSWTENANYTGTRPAYVEAAASSQSVTNAASKASFAINTNAQTIAGAFLCSVASGTSGTLLCVADFTLGNKTADSGDTLDVTYEIGAADA